MGITNDQIRPALWAAVHVFPCSILSCVLVFAVRYHLGRMGGVRYSHEGDHWFFQNWVKYADYGFRVHSISMVAGALAGLLLYFLVTDPELRESDPPSAPFFIAIACGCGLIGSSFYFWAS